ncbi:hypothetical protein [Haladaptatus pallidirubidus]|uniref:hypothetical protein n=1 Tax=Haladaptatus pallidirubidus TaxID=1008152 RepID=UPI001D1169BE|nr:hypothetical protein [Haladaptatus pallidirubidus]
MIITLQEIAVCIPGCLLALLLATPELAQTMISILVGTLPGILLKLLATVGLEPLSGMAQSHIQQPIQRLVRYDDEMLAPMTNRKPVELAEKVWREHDDASRYSLWLSSSSEICAYLAASDLADWIRPKKSCVSKVENLFRDFVELP